jgi:hypothetical protein
MSIKRSLPQACALATSSVIRRVAGKAVFCSDPSSGRDTVAWRKSCSLYPFGGEAFAVLNNDLSSSKKTSWN